MIVATVNQPELCYGLVLLLEAAEHCNKNIATPPSNKERGIVIASSLSHQSSPKLVYSSSSPSPLKKLFFNHYSPSGVRKISPVKKSTKLIYGRGTGTWKRSDFAQALHLKSITVTVDNTTKQEEAETMATEEPQGIVLYDNEDEHHINAIHNIVRRDIWEGFVVSSDAAVGSDDLDGNADARRCGRLARYEGTIGFRCRFCKNEPPNQRAERSAVYPRSLERIYHANIRFQRDHIE